MTRLGERRHRPLCCAHPNGGAGEIPAPTVTVWMGEESRDRFRYVPLLFNELKLKGGICMTQYSFQGPVSEIARRPSLILLLSSVEKELFQGMKNCWTTSHLDKEAGHMHRITFRTFLSPPPIRPMVENTQLPVRPQLNRLLRPERRSVPICLQA